MRNPMHLIKRSSRPKTSTLLLLLLVILVDVVLYFHFMNHTSAAPPSKPQPWLQNRKPSNRGRAVHRDPTPPPEGEAQQVQHAVGRLATASNAEFAQQAMSKMLHGWAKPLGRASKPQGVPWHRRGARPTTWHHQLAQLKPQSTQEEGEADEGTARTQDHAKFFDDWRRVNGEESSGRVEPKWGTKQSMPSMSWTMADGNFTLDRSAPLPEPSWLQVESPTTQPHLDGVPPDLRLQFYVFAAQADCENMGALGSSHNVSLQESLQKCARWDECTAVLFESQNRKAKFCQGYRNVKKNPPSKYLIVSIVKGCEHYGGDAAITDRRNQKGPFCRKQNFMQTSCPPQLHKVQFSVDGPLPLDPPVVCSECVDQAICPELPRVAWEGLQEQRFATQLQKWPASIKQEHPHLHMDPSTGWASKFGSTHSVYNPSIARVGERAYVTVRVSNSSRCLCKSKDNKWKMDRGTGRWASFVAVCQMKTDLTDVEVDTCHLLRDVYDSLQMPEPQALGGFTIFIDNSRFTGLEDPRAFGFNGKLYVLASQGVHMSSPSRRAVRTSKQMLIQLHGNGSTASALIITTVPADAKRQKNFLPLVSHDMSTVYLVTGVYPFQMCQLNLDDGVCTSVTDAHRLQTETTDDVMHWNKGRGSTGFVDTPYGYLGMLHNVAMLDMGRTYSQKWVLLSSEFPHLPIWLSSPFRMPLTHRLPTEDIQFPAGMVLSPDGRSVLVSYGIHDCLSGLVAVALPLREMQAAHDSQHPGQQVALVSKAPAWAAGPIHAQGRSIVRWEGQVTSTTGMAEVTRRLAALMLDDAKFHLELRSMFEKPHVVVHPENDRVFDRVLKANSPLSPDLIVRLGWQHYGPNMALVPPESKLVMYIPWEFEAIPTRWVYVMNNYATEVWTTSEFCKYHFVRSGVKADKVHVIMHGISKSFALRPSLTLSGPDSVHNPKLKGIISKYRQGTRPFVFLYHGGVLWRKGIDRLIQAYISSFDQPGDNVVLVIHYAYAAGLRAEVVVQQLVARYRAYMGNEAGTSVPRIEFLDASLHRDDIVALMDMCDVLVHPSRAEGWGLGVAEAMARGKAVVLPDHGSAVEFTPDHLSYKFPAFRVPCTAYPCSVGSSSFMSQDLFVPQSLMWADFKVEHLGAAMQRAARDPAEAKRRGQLARAHVLANLTWEHAYAAVTHRIDHILHG